MEQTLWYNSNLKINKESLFCQLTYDRGFVRIKDIIIETEPITFRDHAEVGMPWLKYQGLINVIRKARYWNNQTESDMELVKIDSLSNIAKPASYIYKRLINDNTKVCSKYAACWSDTPTGQIEPDVLLTQFRNLYKITSSTKYRDFQYRLLLGKIPTNVDLKTWKLLSSDLCTFCKKVPETLVHLFSDCGHAKKLWNYLRQHVDFLDNINLRKIVLNNFADTPQHISNFIALITKQYLYRVRCQDKIPTIKGLLFTL